MAAVLDVAGLSELVGAGNLGATETNASGESPVVEKVSLLSPTGSLCDPWQPSSRSDVSCRLVAGNFRQLGWRMLLGELLQLPGGFPEACAKPDLLSLGEV